jgi:IclR family acetate operon transcriptional repressor
MTLQVGQQPKQAAAAPVKHRAPSAIGKTVAVLEALAEEHRLSEIARATSLHTSTVHRILQELVALGWARETEDREYALGSHLLALAGRASDDSDIARAGRPALRALCDRTGYTVHFAVRHADEAVYVDKLEGRRAYRMRSRVGLSLPLHCTAIGKAILSALPDDEVRMLIERTGLPRRTQHTIASADAMLPHLATARARGWALDDEENELHTRCIAAVVVDHRGLPIGAISLSALVFDMDRERALRLAPLVVHTAREVSGALGART